MILENFISEMGEKEKSNILLNNKAYYNLAMSGEIEDKIFVGGKLVETRKDHNIIVNSALNLIMALLKNQSGYKGITYWAVGSGATSWETSTVNPIITETKLTNEIGRVAIAASEISFLTSASAVTTTPTNIIKITHTFGEADCNGTWREFGIFGGNATATANSGVMINKKHHSVITKTSDMSVERTMQFTLTFN